MAATGAVLVGAAWAGWPAARLTMGEAIDRIAARHVADAGGAAALADCFGEPGDAWGHWLAVRCIEDGPGGRIHSYYLNRLGWVADRAIEEKAAQPMRLEPLR